MRRYSDRLLTFLTTKSHCHADHTGDPSTFPPCVDLIFGPGAPAARLPGYPTSQKSSLFETDYQGRKLVEITQDKFDLQIGEFRAFDYFGDGSFYLLDVPGHDMASPGRLPTARNPPKTTSSFSWVPTLAITRVNFVLQSSCRYHRRSIRTRVTRGPCRRHSPVPACRRYTPGGSYITVVRFTKWAS